MKNKIHTPSEIINKYINKVPDTYFLILNELLEENIPFDVKTPFVVSKQNIIEKCILYKVQYDDFIHHLKGLIFYSKQKGWKICYLENKLFCQITD